MRYAWGVLTVLLVWCISSARTTAAPADTPPPTINVHKIRDVSKQRIFIPCGSATVSEVIAFRKKLMEAGDAIFQEKENGQGGEEKG